MSAIALCIELADSRPVEEKKQHYEQLNACVDAFSAAMDKCRQMYAEKERISISAPFPSRIIGECCRKFRFSHYLMFTMELFV